MRMARAFTLIELLVVVAIIAVLVSILAPSLNNLYARAEVGACAGNLNAILKSMHDFARDHGTDYPHDPAGQTAGLYRFRLEVGVKAELFICPSTADEPLIAPTSTISYSYQAPFDRDGDGTGDTPGVTVDTKTDVVFLGDKSDQMTAAGFTYDWASLSDRTDSADNTPAAQVGMSQNHLDGRVMNVASPAGSTTVNRADIGHGCDNIFTIGPGQVGTGRPGAGSVITNREDSCLLDTDA